MDRSNKKMINLAEELRCVDAYCYIISMRFGKRLKIEKEIDNELLQLEVPQLILQPLIENATVHGVEKVKSGTIWIKVYKKESNAILQIINTGKGMTGEDQKRVRCILEGRNGDEVRAAALDALLHPLTFISKNEDHLGLLRTTLGMRRTELGLEFVQRNRSFSGARGTDHKPSLLLHALRTQCVRRSGGANTPISKNLLQPYPEYEHGLRS